MSSKKLVCGALLVLLTSALIVKWRSDVGALAWSRSLAELRLADKYHVAMARSVHDLDVAVADIDGEIGKLNSLWFVSAADTEEVRRKWEAYRELVIQERSAFPQ